MTKEDAKFSNFWKACWKDSNWFWKIILILTTPYLWVCYGIAMAGYDYDERKMK